MKRRGSLQGVVALAAMVSLIASVNVAHAAGGGTSSTPTTRVGAAATYTYKKPPRHFDPLSANQSLLRRYGFPARPRKGSAAFKTWKVAMLRAKKYVVPKVRTLVGKTATDYSCNWSGVEDSPGTTGSFIDTQGTWTVPSVASSTKTSLSSQWVGQGGTGSATLEQAGTEADYNSTSGTQNYYPWYEIYPQQSQQEIYNVSVSPGDTVYVDASYNSKYNEEFFYLENETTGQYTNPGDPLKDTFSGSTSEWIVERTALNNTPQLLAKFKQVEMTSDYASTTTVNDKNYTYWYHPDVVMTQTGSSSGLLLAQDYGNGSTYFYDQWFNYGASGC